MKIIMIEPSGKRGLCQYTHNLSHALAGRDHDVCLATSTDFETKHIPAKYEALEVFNRFSIEPLRLVRFIRFLRKTAPHVIHIQGAIHPLFYLILWRFLSLITAAPFVYTSHDVLPKKKRFYNQFALRTLYRTIPGIIVHSNRGKQYIVDTFKVKPEKISVLSVGNLLAFSKQLTDLNKADLPEGKKVVLFLGIIEPHKGLMTLIRAFKEIRERVQEAILYIAGQPFENMKPYLKELKRVGIENSVHLKLGYIPVEEIPGIMKNAHLVVLPYDNTSQSGIVLSAYFFSKPVVATTVGGLTELVQDGETGLLVPPGDSEALSKAVITLLQNDELRKKMGNKAFEVVERDHSWESIARETEVVYSNVCS